MTGGIVLFGALTRFGDCPGCGHDQNEHVARFCYACGPQINIPLPPDKAPIRFTTGGICQWQILGEGNAFGLPAGWHNDAFEQAEWREDWYSNPGDAWWERP